MVIGDYVLNNSNEFIKCVPPKVEFSSNTASFSDASSVVLDSSDPISGKTVPFSVVIEPTATTWGCALSADNRSFRTSPIKQVRVFTENSFLDCKPIGTSTSSIRFSNLRIGNTAPDACTLTLTPSLAEASPIMGSGTHTIRIMPKLECAHDPNQPNPAAGQIIQLSSEPVENTGGHMHGGDRKDIGKFDAPACKTHSGGSCDSVHYTASQFSGIERLSAYAFVNGVEFSTTLDLPVKVPDLVEIFPDVTFSPHWRPS
jgi:hypothetical protein